MNRKEIAKKFREAADNKNLTPEQEDDAVRLYLCLFFRLFLFTNSFCELLLGLLRYIEKLEMLHTIDWAEATRYTLEKIPDCQARLRENNHGEMVPSVNLTGCPAALQIWVAEHTDICSKGATTCDAHI